MLIPPRSIAVLLVCLVVFAVLVVESLFICCLEYYFYF